MSGYATQLSAIVAVAEQHQDLPYLEERRCRRPRCGRIYARVVSVNGHRLYVTYVPKRHVAEAVRQTARLYKAARSSGGRAPRNAPHRVELFYALLDHPGCPGELPAWCPHGRDVQLETSTLC